MVTASRSNIPLCIGLLIEFWLAACGEGIIMSGDSPQDGIFNELGCELVAQPISAIRFSNEPWESAYNRNLEIAGQQASCLKNPSRDSDSMGTQQSALTNSDECPTDDCRTVHESALPWNEIENSPAIDQVPDWSWEKLQANFNKLRDRHYLLGFDFGYWPRRIPWLYPDDGCFARAHEAIKSWWLMGREYEMPVAKAFIFGDLVFSTPHHPKGIIHWSYHVVPIVKVDSVIYALDPTFGLTGPVPLLDMMKAIKGILVSICDANAYDPDDTCLNGETASIHEPGHRQELVSKLLSEEERQFSELDRPPDILQKFECMSGVAVNAYACGSTPSITYRCIDPFGDPHQADSKGAMWQSQPCKTECQAGPTGCAPE